MMSIPTNDFHLTEQIDETKSRKAKERGTSRLSTFCKTIAIGLAFTGAMLLNPIKAHAHDAWFMSVAVDFGNEKYQTTIITDENGADVAGHLEAKAGKFALLKGKDIPTIKTGSSEELEASKEKYIDKGVVSKDKYNADKDSLIYTFPSFHNGGWFKAEIDGTGTDRERAYEVANILGGALNDAISWVKGQAYGKQTRSGTSFINDTTKMANEVGKAVEAGKSGSGSFKVNGKTFKVKTGIASDKISNGTKQTDYVTITAPNGDSVSFLYRIVKGYNNPSGYAENLPIPSSVLDLYKKDINYISWKELVVQGNWNYIDGGMTYSNIGELVNESKITQYFSEFLDAGVSQVRGLLGLYSFQELMLNEGARATSTYNGIMSLSWMDSAEVLNWVCQGLAWVIILGAMVKLFASRNLSAINPVMRVNLMDGVQRLLITGFALIFITPLFSVVTTLNYKLVAIFANASNYTDMFGTSKMGSGLLGEIIVQIPFFILTIYFNFVYIMRAITISILYATAPLFVVSIAFGAKYQQLFSNWVKELLGNIFLQTFHAILIAFFTSIVAVANVRMMESLVMLIAFIPLTNMFRQNIMGVGGGISGAVGGQALGAGMAVAGGLITSASANKSKGSSSGASSTGTDISGVGGTGGGTGNVATAGFASQASQNPQQGIKPNDVNGQRSMIDVPEGGGMGTVVDNGIEKVSATGSNLNVDSSERNPLWDNVNTVGDSNKGEDFANVQDIQNRSGRNIGNATMESIDEESKIHTQNGVRDRVVGARTKFSETVSGAKQSFGEVKTRATEIKANYDNFMSKPVPKVVRSTAKYAGTALLKTGVQLSGAATELEGQSERLINQASRTYQSYQNHQPSGNVQGDDNNQPRVNSPSYNTQQMNRNFEDFSDQKANDTPVMEKKVINRNREDT